MPSGSENHLQFEIGHVLFIDLVGYSKLLIEEQKEHLGQLIEIVLATAQVRGGGLTSNSLGYRQVTEWRWSFATAPRNRRAARWRLPKR